MRGIFNYIGFMWVCIKNRSDLDYGRIEYGVWYYGVNIFNVVIYSVFYYCCREGVSVVGISMGVV